MHKQRPTHCKTMISCICHTGQLC